MRKSGRKILCSVEAVSVHNKIVIKNIKIGKMLKSNKFSMTFQLKDSLRSENKLN